MARAAGITNTVTAADLGLVMAAVARREPALGGPAVCEPVEQMLSRQQHLDQIPAGLPSGHPDGEQVGLDPGRLARRRDRAAASGEEPFVLAICTTSTSASTRRPAFVASIAADVWAADHEPIHTRGDSGGAAMTTIDRVETRTSTVRLHTPFVTALRRTETTDTVVVTITDSDGRVGWGEAPQVWQVTGESLASATACIETMLAPALVGHAPRRP